MIFCTCVLLISALNLGEFTPIITKSSRYLRFRYWRPDNELGRYRPSGYKELPAIFFVLYSRVNFPDNVNKGTYHTDSRNFLLIFSSLYQSKMGEECSVNMLNRALIFLKGQDKDAEQQSLIRGWLKAEGFNEQKAKYISEPGMAEIAFGLTVGRIKEYQLGDITAQPSALDIKGYRWGADLIKFDDFIQLLNDQ